MALPSLSKTLTVTIAAAPVRVAEFVRNVANLPQWATAFCLSARFDGQQWQLETTLSPMTIRFAPENPWGVLDHTVSPPSGPAVSVPMRVVAHGAGSEVMLTLFRGPAISDAQFADDASMVARDLATLKRLLEA